MASAAEARAFLQDDFSPATLAGVTDRRLELLARVRAEQLMSLRLLKLLARCADLDRLSDPEGEAAAVLDVKRRRELRAWDFEESIAELRALLQARHEGQLRTRDGRRATRLAIPGASHELD
jgi:hypothetical protein